MQRITQSLVIQAHVTRGQQAKLIAPQPEHLHALAPRIMRSDRRQHLRHTQLLMPAEEPSQPEMLDALRLNPRIPALSLGR